MSNRTLALTDALYEYMASISLREPGFLRRLRDETARLPDSSMQISPEQGQFMALLVRLMGATRILEIGVFTGYSSTCMAMALPPDGVLVACDIDEDYARTARRYWAEAGVEDRIDLRLGPALETLDRLITEGREGTFDFAFIDADKKEYAAYYERCLTLLRTGGLVAVDNIFWSGRVIDPAVNDASTSAIRAFNRKVKGDNRVALSLVPIGDGLTLALKLRSGA